LPRLLKRADGSAQYKPLTWSEKAAEENPARDNKVRVDFVHLSFHLAIAILIQQVIGFSYHGYSLDHVQATIDAIFLYFRISPLDDRDLGF